MSPTTHPTASQDSAADGTRDGDPRFTFGLVFDVAKAIERHGYDDVLCGAGMTELSFHLFALLHGTDDGRDGYCFGKALAQAQQREAQHGQGQRQ